MENKLLFNEFNLTNEEIEKILLDFDNEIKNAIKKINGCENQDYEQVIRIQIYKALSRNRKKFKNFS